MNCPAGCNRNLQRIDDHDIIMKYGDAWLCPKHGLWTDFAVKMYNKIPTG